jgi:5-oxoprolinase (ATP-hydrolysing)
MCSFTRAHHQMFTYALDLSIEIINLRGLAEETSKEFKVQELPKSADGKPSDDAIHSRTSMVREDPNLPSICAPLIALEYSTGIAKPTTTSLLLRAGDVIHGPAIVTEMDSNTFVHPDHSAEIDDIGNILLWPSREVDSKERTGENQKIVTQLIEAALANARAEMDGLIVRVAMSPAMCVLSRFPVHLSC